MSEMPGLLLNSPKQFLIVCTVLTVGLKMLRIQPRYQWDTIQSVGTLHQLVS